MPDRLDEVLDGRAPAWIEPGVELPAVHQWASRHLDRQEACRMVEVRLRELEIAIAAAQAARAAREIATPAALAELRDLGPAGTRAEITLGGQLYAVHFEDGRIVLLTPPPTQPEEQCP